MKHNRERSSQGVKDHEAARGNLQRGPVSKRLPVSWEERVLTYDELKLMLQKLAAGVEKGTDATQFQRHRNLMILELLAATGLRAAELCRLTIGDLRLPACNDAWVRVIGGKRRTLGQAERVPVPAHLAPALLGWWDRITTARDLQRFYAKPLFARSLHLPDDAITYAQLWAMIKRTAAAAGLRSSISPHSFRHYYISELARQPGMDPLRLATAARLRDPRTALRYIHYAKGEIQAIANKVRLPGRKRL